MTRSPVCISNGAPYRLRLALQEIYQRSVPRLGKLILDRWYSWAIRSRLALKKVAQTIK